jgi:hypothetical protein
MTGVISLRAGRCRGAHCPLALAVGVGAVGRGLLLSVAWPFKVEFNFLVTSAGPIYLQSSAFELTILPVGPSP